MASKTFIIGRDRGADIPIADSSVSRRHAQVEFLAGGELFVTDCQLGNGTFILRSGQAVRISQETVSSGDQVRFGDVVMAVSDLADMARRVGGVPPSPQPGQHAASVPLAKSEKLVRCICGAVIIAGMEHSQS